jgi:hypothetical protein
MTLLRASGGVIAGIGGWILVPSVILQMYVQDQRETARILEHLKNTSGATPEADASYENLIIIGWIGIVIGAVWVLAGITCFLVARTAENAKPPASEA